MAPVKAPVSCPNCRQPNMVEVEQLFDLHEDPQAKQRLLSGQVNLIRCTACGYQGQIPQVIVYHDPAKELLLTFFPPELGMNRDAQEKMIGPLIKKVVNGLPAEMRKAYLFQPQTMLTQATLYETILASDGITKEMLQSQQDRLNLLQELVNLSDEAAAARAQEKVDLLDREFFTLISAIAQNAVSSGNQALAQRLGQIQEIVLPFSEYGNQVIEQTREVELAIEALQAVGSQLTRTHLLDLVVEAPNDTRLRAFVSLARDGMDYEFFQILSQRIDQAADSEKESLSALREKLVTYTRDYDQQIQSRVDRFRDVIDQILSTEDPKETIIQNMHLVDDMFLQVLEAEISRARSANDLVRSGKLRSLREAIEEANTPPSEVAFIESLMEAPTPEARWELLQQSPEMVTPEMMEILTGLLSQVNQSEDETSKAQIGELYRDVVRFSMQSSLKQG